MSDASPAAGRAQAPSPGATRTRLAPWYLNLVPYAAEFVIRALRATLRLRAHGRETVEAFARDGQRYIHVFWHAHLLMMVYSYIGPDILFLVSRSRDGELITRTLARFGYTMARGSSSSGGSAALREMLRAVRQGRDIGFTPDGPRGPARVTQPGTVAAARALGIPIVPVAFGAARAWKLRTWDRFVVPQPFSRALLVYGPPLTIGAGEEIDAAAARVTAALDDAGAFAARHAGDPSVGTPI